ncbi:MAG: redoxin domain-containing protein [Cyclobacteriaceae bacterium]|nr:redoxin domain-containing protein [Cyclobacteriaceae bacterium]
MINHSSDQIRLSEYKGKLLIIDFWATWCSPCIAMFPKTDSLQKKFSDKVVFLPVTYQSKEEVTKLFSKASRLKNIRLPMVTGDKTLHELFPHKELPHYVWIGRDGVVKAITGHHEVNEATINKMLTEPSQSLTEKKDAMKVYNPEVPLLFQPIGIEQEHMLFQSMLTRYVEGVQSRFDVIRDEQGSVTRITMANAWIQLMFALAWSDETRYFSRNRIVLDVKDPSGVISNQEGAPFKAWLRDHAWCYELIVPSHLLANVFEIMRSDMTRLFPQYIASVEKRAMPCLVLVRTSDNDKIKSSQASAVTNVDAFSLSITNSSIQLLVSQLNHYLQHLNKPVIDETGYKGNVDINLDARLSSVDDLRRALKAYDLDLIEKKHDIEVLVIRDAN